MPTTGGERVFAFARGGTLNAQSRGRSGPRRRDVERRAHGDGDVIGDHEQADDGIGALDPRGASVHEAWLDRGRACWPRRAVRPVCCSSRRQNTARLSRSRTACPRTEKAASDPCRPAALRRRIRPRAGHRRWGAADPTRPPRRWRASARPPLAISGCRVLCDRDYGPPTGRSNTRPVKHLAGQRAARCAMASASSTRASRSSTGSMPIQPR